MATKKVLFIDSDGYTLRMYEEMLSAVDFEVITASDGERGLFLAKDKKPDIIVSEVKLERQTGLELLKDIKNDPEINKIPLVFLTNSSDRQDIKTALSLGVSEYLIKPHHTPTEVVGVIIQIIKK